MTIDINAKNILISYIQICDKHADKLQAAILKTSHLFPLTIEIFSNLNEVDAAFLEVVTSRFAKLQDTCGQKIFSLVLACSGEDVSNKTFVDILNMFEKFGFIEDANFWIELRRVRNAVAHEYPDDLETLIIDINAVYCKAKELLIYWSTLKVKMQQLIL
jgi:hypothetical protein